MTQHYFAKDGSFGSAEDLVIAHTDMLTEEDWQEIEDSHDSTRTVVAVEILKRRHNVIPLRLTGL